jgi:hypothetical protein
VTGIVGSSTIGTGAVGTIGTEIVGSVKPIVTTVGSTRTIILEDEATGTASASATNKGAATRGMNFGGVLKLLVWGLLLAV